MPALFDFLQKNTIEFATSLPLVHTSRARLLRRFLDTGKLVASDCDIFVNEKLNYFFVGRPAFKFTLPKNAEVWELPICFVMNQEFTVSPKRVFPFDSGGFADRMPSFMKGMELGEFDVSGDSSAPNKIIGTFFGNARNYFRLRGIDADEFNSDHEVSLLESEIRALHRLTNFRSSTFDDRQFAIEVQTEETCTLNNKSLGALIVPSPYLDDEQFWERVERQFGCEVLGYDCYPINPEAYYYGIYSRVESYLDSVGAFQ